MSSEAQQADYAGTSSPSRIWLMLLLLAVFPLIAYWSTLNNYFVNADFAHVQYAYYALKQPALFLHEFSDSWLGARDFELCYRPLPIFLLAFNLMTSGVNPLGFHLTNVVLHIACVWSVFFFTRELVPWVSARRVDANATNTAFWAAALFSVYPVLAEAIDWIGGRPDCAASLFSILTLLFWLKEQRTGKQLFGWSSLVSYLVALLFKETAITLIVIPAILCMLRPVSAKEKLITAAKSSWKLFIALMIYFGLRWNALGTVYGGYKGTYWRLLGTSEYLDRWTDAGFVQRLFLPFNSEDRLAVQTQPVLTVLYVLGLLFGLSNFQDLRAKLKLVFFCIIWAVVAVLPALQTAFLTSSFSGGRVFYLSCIPLCMLFAIVLTPQTVEVARRTVGASVIAGCLLLCFGVATVWNNDSWNRSAAATRALQLQLDGLIKQTPTDRKVLVLNPPITIAGQNGLNQALLPVTQTPPFMPDSNYHRVAFVDREHYVDRDANLINATVFRQILLSSPTVARWDPKELKLIPLEMIPDTMPVTAHSVIVQPLASENPDVSSFEIVIDPSLTPFTCEAIEVELQCEGTAKPAFATLTWRENWNAAANDLYEADVYHGIEGDGKPHVYRFPMAEQIGWYMHHHFDSLYLTIHNVRKIQNLSAKLATDAYYVPRLREDRRFFTRTSTGLEARPQGAAFICDTEVKDAVAILVELSQPNECFETYTRTYRDTDISSHAKKRWTATGTSASFSIPSTDLFPGTWCVRAASLDKDHRIIGAFSDPVTFKVK